MKRQSYIVLVVGTIVITVWRFTAGPEIDVHATNQAVKWAVSLMAIWVGAIEWNPKSTKK